MLPLSEKPDSTRNSPKFLCLCSASVSVCIFVYMCVCVCVCVFVCVCECVFEKFLNAQRRLIGVPKREFCAPCFLNCLSGGQIKSVVITPENMKTLRVFFQINLVVS